MGSNSNCLADVVDLGAGTRAVESAGFAESAEDLVEVLVEDLAAVAAESSASSDGRVAVVDASDASSRSRDGIHRSPSQDEDEGRDLL